MSPDATTHMDITSNNVFDKIESVRKTTTSALIPESQRLASSTQDIFEWEYFIKKTLRSCHHDIFDVVYDQQNVNSYVFENEATKNIYWNNVGRLALCVIEENITMRLPIEDENPATFMERVIKLCKNNSRKIDSIQKIAKVEGVPQDREFLSQLTQHCILMRTENISADDVLTIQTIERRWGINSPFANDQILTNMLKIVSKNLEGGKKTDIADLLNIYLDEGMSRLSANTNGEAGVVLVAKKDKAPRSALPPRKCFRPGKGLHWVDQCTADEANVLPSYLARLNNKYKLQLEV